MKTILCLILLQAGFLAFAEDIGEVVYKGNAVDKNPPALSYLAFNLMDVTGLEEEDLTNLQDLAPNESCQVSLHEHPDLLPSWYCIKSF